MGMGWYIYTKSTVDELADRFRDLPEKYPELFACLSTNTILPRVIDPDRATYVIYDPRKAQWYNIEDLEEAYNFTPVSIIYLEHGDHWELRDSQGLAFLMAHELKEIEYIMLFNGEASDAALLKPCPDNYEPPTAYRPKT